MYKRVSHFQVGIRSCLCNYSMDKKVVKLVTLILTIKYALNSHPKNYSYSYMLTPFHPQTTLIVIVL